MPLLATFATDQASAVIMLIALPVLALALDRTARSALSRWLARDAGLAGQTRIGIST